MSDTLDRKRPYSEVQGDSRAAFYQAGNYYNSKCELIPAEEAGKPSEGGSFISQVEARVEQERAKENATRPLELIDENNPRTNSPASILAAKARSMARRAVGLESEPPVVDDVVETPKPTELDAKAETLAEKREKLEAIHFSQIRNMVAKIGHVPAVGKGGKAKNIAILLDNTE